MMVELAAALLFLLGLAHSVLGERYLLTRLFRRDNLPKLLGSTAFTVGTLRFVWHLTTLAWYGLATLLLLAARDEIDVGSTLRGIAAVALVSALLPAFFTRGRHLSWVVFLAVAGLLFAAQP